MSILSAIGLDKESMARDAIQDTLKDVLEELKCLHDELFIMIKPCDEKMNFKLYLYRLEVGKQPAFVREMTMKEVIGDEDEKTENK